MSSFLREHFLVILVVWGGITSVWLASYLKPASRKIQPPLKLHPEENWADWTEDEVDFLFAAFQETGDRIKQEKSIKLYLKTIQPELGDMGKAAYLASSYGFVVTRVFRTHGINVMLSNKMGLSRRLPDVRYPICQAIIYDFLSLPMATIIITFHDEPASVILRALHSLVKNTKWQLMKEIILVDDNSAADELHGPLRHYIRTRLPTDTDIVLLKTYDRLGIIQARAEAVKIAKGEVLIFLHPYVEVTKGWIEPLLHRIRDKRDAVVMPIIDTISPLTFEYQRHNDSKILGGFTWDGKAVWIDIPDRLTYTAGLSFSPIPTPTMVGGLFAIDTMYFLKLGGFDEDMIGARGDNLELSFRTWQCGGSLEVIPCSRVGHLFGGSVSPKYNFPSNQSTELYNLARTADLWMDDYSRLFYLYNKRIEFGNTDDRRSMKEQLKCKSFKWYLENIYPEKFIPDQNVAAYGRVRLTTNNLCLDTSKRYTDRKSVTLKVGECRNETVYNQFFALTNTGLLRTEFDCAIVRQNTSKVKMNDCNCSTDRMKWKLLENGFFVHLSSGLCLDATGLTAHRDISVRSCRHLPGQTWEFDYYNIDIRGFH